MKIKVLIVINSINMNQQLENVINYVCLAHVIPEKNN